jgi:hypothetical protein
MYLGAGLVTVTHTMQRNLALAFLSLGLLTGCGTTAIDSESTREVVQQYLGVDSAVGTSGPYSKTAKQELDVLSPADRSKATSLVDQGAVVFLVYGGARVAGSDNPPVSRVILVQKDRVVGDFRAQPKS